MGAWDVGMRSNDAAADAIYLFRTRIDKMNLKGSGVLPLLRDVAVKFKRSPEVTACVLGVTQALLDLGVIIPASARQFLTSWIGRAVVEISSEGWSNPTARLLAIGRFSRNVMGEKIPTKGDNQSLMEGIQNVARQRRFSITAPSAAEILSHE
jgi:hypothetical protein